MSGINVNFPETLYQAVNELALREQMSIQQFITFAVTEQIAHFKRTDYLTERAKYGNRAKFKQAMSKVQANKPPLSEHGALIDLYNLARSYQQWGETAKVIAYYEQALSLSQQFQDRSASGIILRDLGQVYRDLGQMDKARDYLQQAWAIFEELKSPYAEETRQLLAK
jgi:tetratricopeptide (TPR) repeat protein